MFSIKINRARSLTAVGRYPGSFADMLASIPVEIVDALPSRHLAALLDATWETCERTKALAAAAVCAEGAVWDARKGAMREIV